jgi:hypothetical protein
VLGKKKIDIDYKSINFLKSIRRKYEKEYLIFFTNLSKLYVKGATRKEIDHTLSLIKKVSRLINHAVLDGVISKKEASGIYQYIDEVEKAKNDFIDKTAEVKAFRERVEKVSEKTGIGIEELNITGKEVKKGVKKVKTGRERRGVVSRIGGFVGRAVKGAAKTTIKGLGVASLGPIAPVIGAALGMGRRAGVSGVGSFISKPAIARDIGSYRPRGEGINRGIYDLFQFFNVYAYKAKWTKELLKAVKEGGRITGGGGLIKKLFLGATLVGGAAAFGKNIIEETRDLVTSSIGLAVKRGELETSKEFQTRLRAEIGKKTVSGSAADKERRAKNLGISVFELEREQRKREIFAGEAVARQEAKSKSHLPPVVLGAGAALAGVKMPHPELVPGGPMVQIPKISKESKDAEEMKKVAMKLQGEINKLSNSVLGLSKSVEKEKESQQVKISDSWILRDSADPLINAHASGELTVK